MEAQYRSAEVAYAKALAAVGFQVLGGGGYAYTEGTGQATLQASLSLGVLPYSPASEALRAARKALERAELSLRAGKMDLVLTLAQRYYAAYLAGKNLEVAQKALEVAQSAYRAAQARRAQGQLAPSGLLQAEADLKAAEAALAQAEADRVASLAALYALLGRPVGLDPATPPPETLPSVPDLETALRGLSSLPEVARAQNTLEDAQASLTYAERSRFLPQGSLILAYGQGTGASSLGLNLNLATGTLSVSGTYAPGAGGSGRFQASLSLALPLVDPGGEAQVAAAKAALEGALAALDQARFSAEATLRGRLAAYRAALDQLEAAQAAHRAAVQGEEEARLRLQAGLISPLELAQAQLARLRAAYAVESARVSAYLAWLALQRAQGQLEVEQ
ncbi:TolC family protein [Thermus oshimai]|uniref:TolC family protein n=1 Tax=Thermus oshimai TaxID=56957 RepID=UPI0003754D7E